MIGKRLGVLVGGITVIAITAPGCSPRNVGRMAATGVRIAMSESSEYESDPCDDAYYSLSDAVYEYYEANKSYPPDFQSLVPSFVDAVPSCPGKNFGYNPLTGEVFPTDEGPSSQDYLMMPEITKAINNYGNATGLYPPTLDDLYPNFMTTLPRTSRGEYFIYNNQNGEVTHPREGKEWGEEWEDDNEDWSEYSSDQ